MQALLALLPSFISGVSSMTQGSLAADASIQEVQKYIARTQQINSTINFANQVEAQRKAMELGTKVDEGNALKSALEKFRM